MRCRNLRVRGQEHQIPRTNYQLRRPQGSLRVPRREDRRTQLRLEQVSGSGEVHQQTQQLHREGQTTRRTQLGEVESCGLFVLLDEAVESADERSEEHTSELQSR